MRTAISIPDSLFRKADLAASELRISRSELYRRALDVYLRAREQASVTERLDRFFDDNPDLNGPEAGWSEAQAQAIGQEPW